MKLSKHMDLSITEVSGEIYKLIPLEPEQVDSVQRQKKVFPEQQKIKIGSEMNKEYRAEMFVLKANYTGELPVVIYFLAANPANNFYGTSANQYVFPFPSERIAFENTPNKKIISLDRLRNFEIPFVAPGPFLTDNGKVFHEPQIFLKFIHVKVIRANKQTAGHSNASQFLTIPLDGLKTNTYSVKLKE